MAQGALGARDPRHEPGSSTGCPASGSRSTHTPETADEEIAETLLGLVRENPGRSWNAYDPNLTGKGLRKRTVRDEMIEAGRLVNLGMPGKAMRLYLPEQVEQMPLDEGAS